MGKLVRTPEIIALVSEHFRSLADRSVFSLCDIMCDRLEAEARSRRLLAS